MFSTCSFKNVLKLKTFTLELILNQFYSMYSQISCYVYQTYPPQPPQTGFLSIKITIGNEKGPLISQFNFLMAQHQIEMVKLWDFEMRNVRSCHYMI